MEDHFGIAVAAVMGLDLNAAKVLVAWVESGPPSLMEVCGAGVCLRKSIYSGWHQAFSN